VAIVNIDNRYSSTLAMIAGVMITITRLLIPQFYPSESVNGWTTLFAELSTAGLKPFSFLAGALSLLVEFGGISIFAGGLLCYKNHLVPARNSSASEPPSVSLIYFSPSQHSQVATLDLPLLPLWAGQDYSSQYWLIATSKVPEGHTLERYVGSCPA